MSHAHVLALCIVVLGITTALLGISLISLSAAVRNILRIEARNARCFRAAADALDAHQDQLALQHEIIERVANHCGYWQEEHAPPQ